MVKHMDPARKNTVEIQSIMRSFSAIDLPGWVGKLGNSKKYAGEKTAPMTRLM
jgi:hypothetical protein